MTNETETETNVAGERLKSFIERIERLKADAEEIKTDIKEVYSEAKGVGFDTKVMREIVKIRKADPEKRREFEEILDLYKQAIGVE